MGQELHTDRGGKSSQEIPQHGSSKLLLSMVRRDVFLGRSIGGRPESSGSRHFSQDEMDLRLKVKIPVDIS